MRLKEDRSWVVPLAFVTFGGILFAAIGLFLKLEHLLLSDRGSALVAWLTLLFTVFAALAALMALGIALNQMKDSRIQTEIVQRKELSEKISTIKKADLAHLQIEHKFKIIINCISSGNEEHYLPEEATQKLYDDLKELRIKIVDFQYRDTFKEIYPEYDIFYAFQETLDAPMSWLQEKIDSGGFSETSKDDKHHIIEKMEEYTILKDIIDKNIEINLIKTEDKLDEITLRALRGG
ncbi:hypothetical protein FMN50_20360 [Rhodobacterales bacterium]|nr:hypothetical protein FMN50_20360 [Rhodobacterales bacterium]